MQVDKPVVPAVQHGTVPQCTHGAHDICATCRTMRTYGTCKLRKQGANNNCRVTKLSSPRIYDGLKTSKRLE